MTAKQAYQKYKKNENKIKALEASNRKILEQEVKRSDIVSGTVICYRDSQTFKNHYFIVDRLYSLYSEVQKTIKIYAYGRKCTKTGAPRSWRCSIGSDDLARSTVILKPIAK